MQARLMQITLAARQHATVIAEIEDESVFQQSIFFQLPDQPCNHSIHLSDAVEVPRIGEAKSGGVRMIGSYGDRIGIGFGAILFKGLLGEVKRTFMRHSEGVHVKEGSVLGRAFAPAGFA